MKKIGKIIDIFSAKKSDAKSLPRPKVDKLNLITNYGIENDKFANKDLNKSVMIVGLNSYNLAQNNSINLEKGSLGENILLDFDPHKYDIGDIFILENAKIEITGVCTVCNHLNIFDKNLVKLLKNQRGLYCKILENGIISQNTEVFIKE